MLKGASGIDHLELSSSSSTYHQSRPHLYNEPHIMNVLPTYHDLCRQQRPDLKLDPYTFDVETLNEFLKEAYRIVSTPHCPVSILPR